MSLRDITKGDGSTFTDAEKIEVMCSTQWIRDAAMRFIQAVEVELINTKRSVKKLHYAENDLPPEEIRRLKILRAIVRDFLPLKNKMIEKGRQQ